MRAKFNDQILQFSTPNYSFKENYITLDPLECFVTKCGKVAQIWTQSRDYWLEKIFKLDKFAF